MKKIFAFAIIAVCLAGCGQKAAVKKAVIANLVDPDSAKFGEVTINDRGDLACVTINAKNKMGGYTGNSQMLMAKLESGDWGRVNDSDDQTHADCVVIMKAMPKV